tara:strand:- start:733 stop:1275 length:543 start_codon:yes stop_codon:yes gene_type:complete
MSILKVNTIQEADGTAFNFGQWNYGTAFDYDTTSLTDAAMTGWTSDWQQIRISFINLSSNGNAYFQAFVSTSSNASNMVTSGYETSSAYTGSGSGGTYATSQILFYGTGSSAYDMSGELNFYRFDDSTARYSGQLVSTQSNYTFFVDGNIPITCNNMTHVFLRSQGYNWDSGKFKVDYLA